MHESTIKAVVFWAVVVFTIWAVWWNLQSIILTTLAVVLLMASLSSFYLPTIYTLDKDGARLKRWFIGRDIEWPRVRSVSDERDGLFLSPFPTKSRLENFRGIYLPYRNNRVEIIAVVRFYTPNAAGLPAIDDDDDDKEQNNSKFKIQNSKFKNVNPFGI